MVIVYIIILLIILAFLMANFVVNTAFGKRCDRNPNLKYFTANDFENLVNKPIEFKSNKGQMLRGYLYTNNSVEKYKGLIIFVHGMNGGHLSYTTEINTFAKAGFMVMAYDNTGTWFSEGKNLKGFFQSVLDLKYALKYVSENDDLNKYDINLVGHSWGAFTVCQVLQYNPNVKKVVAMSGFNNSSKIICDTMKEQLKVNCSIFRPFFTVLNFIKFGKDGIKNTVDILDKTSTQVLVLHGDSDASVTRENSLCSKVLENKDNIKIVVYEGRFHNVYQTKESEQYLNDTFGNIEKAKKQYKGKLPQEEIERLYGSIDYKKMTEEDEAVMDTIIKFIEG